MTSKLNPSRVFLVLSFLVHCSCSNAFNITEILSQYPDFSSFSDALTQTQVASAINSRQTLTVLALDNGAMSGVPGSQDTRRTIMNLHVILDYFDLAKLQNMPQKSTILTTLYQTTGLANGMQGFLNVTVKNNGVMIGSAVPGSNLGSSLIKSIASQPYNISVLQVSGAIVPPDVGGNTNSSTSPPSPPGASSPPASSPKPSPVIPLPPKFGNAPVPSATPPHSGTTPPPGTGATPPSGTGATPPSGTGATPPSGTGATPPSGTGATPPSGTGATPPSGTGATPPSGTGATPPSGTGATPPSGTGATPPSGTGATPPSGTGATPPSGTGATPPAGATSPSDAAATTPADAAANSPAGVLPAVPGNAPSGSPPMPAGAGTVADSPLADAPAGGSSASGRSYHSLDHASLLMMSFAVIWSVALLI